MRAMLIAILACVCGSALAWQLPATRRAMMMDAMTPAASGTLGQGLIAHYTMNDTSGTIITSSKGNNATCVVNVATMTTTGKIGNALKWNNSVDQRATTGYQPSTGAAPFSVSCWMYSTNLSLTPQYFAVGWGEVVNLKGIHVSWEYTSSKIIFDKWGSGTDSLRTASRQDNSQWHYVCGTYDGTNAYLWVDTTNIGTKAWAMNVTSGYPLILGTRHTYFDGKFDGILDDLRFYNRGISSNEMMQIYNGGAGTEAE